MGSRRLYSKCITVCNTLNQIIYLRPRPKALLILVRVEKGPRTLMIVAITASFSLIIWNCEESHVIRASTDIPDVQQFHGILIETDDAVVRRWASAISPFRSTFPFKCVLLSSCNILLTLG
jgi:hypothetical protein